MEGSSRQRRIQMWKELATGRWWSNYGEKNSTKHTLKKMSYIACTDALLPEGGRSWKHGPDSKDVLDSQKNTKEGDDFPEFKLEYTPEYRAFAAQGLAATYLGQQRLRSGEMPTRRAIEKHLRLLREDAPERFDDKKKDSKWAGSLAISYSKISWSYQNKDGDSKDFDVSLPQLGLDKFETHFYTVIRMETQQGTSDEDLGILAVCGMDEINSGKALCWLWLFESHDAAEFALDALSSCLQERSRLMKTKKWRDPFTTLHTKKKHSTISPGTKHLKWVKEIGSGNFGVVYRADIVDSSTAGSRSLDLKNETEIEATVCAVKMCKEFDDLLPMATSTKIDVIVVDAVQAILRVERRFKNDRVSTTRAMPLEEIFEQLKEKLATSKRAARLSDWLNNKHEREKLKELYDVMAEESTFSFVPQWNGFLLKESSDELQRKRKEQQDAKEGLEKEAKILQQLGLQQPSGGKCAQICHLVSFMPEDPMMLALEFAEHGSMSDLLKSTVTKVAHKRLSKEDRCNIYLQAMDCAMQVALGLKYVHAQRILHLDLALRNVLVGEQSADDTQEKVSLYKIADFGQGQMFDDDAKEIAIPRTFKLAIAWTSNEALVEPTNWSTTQERCDVPENTRRNLTEKTDVYSFGVVLWELINCSNPRKPPPRPWKHLDLVRMNAQLQQSGMDEEKRRALNTKIDELTKKPGILNNGQDESLTSFFERRRKEMEQSAGDAIKSMQQLEGENQDEFAEELGPRFSDLLKCMKECLKPTPERTNCVDDIIKILPAASLFGFTTRTEANNLGRFIKDKLAKHSRITDDEVLLVHAAAKGGDVLKLRELRKDHRTGAELPMDAADEKGATPLMHACEGGHFFAFEFLWKECDAKTTARDKKGRTILHYLSRSKAIGVDHLRILKALFNTSTGLSLDNKTKIFGNYVKEKEKGRTPLHYLIDSPLYSKHSADWEQTDREPKRFLTHLIKQNNLWLSEVASEVASNAWTSLLELDDGKPRDKAGKNKRGERPIDLTARLGMLNKLIALRLLESKQAHQNAVTPDHHDNTFLSALPAPVSSMVYDAAQTYEAAADTPYSSLEGMFRHSSGLPSIGLDQPYKCKFCSIIVDVYT